MRVIIVPGDTMIPIDGEPIQGCDVSWIPEFVGDITGVSQKVHAVQWYDDHGEIVLVNRDSNIPITELGVFEQAITKYEERKLSIQESIHTDIDIDTLLAELESDQTL